MSTRQWVARDSVAAAAKQQSRLSAGREGFVLKSADGDFQLSLRGYIQAEQIEVNYEDTRFTGGASTGNRAPEHFLVTRIQQAF